MQILITYFIKVFADALPVFILVFIVKESNYRKETAKKEYKFLTLNHE